MAYSLLRTLREFWAFRRSCIVIITPILAAILPICIPGTESKAAYVLIIMAVFWVTEALPLSATALLPLVMFPLLGVMTAGSVSVMYMKDTNALFLGGLIVAVAIEHWNLHKRIALRVLLLVGSNIRWLMLGFMIPTACLSMFISNTATTAMMTPIAQAVLTQLIAKQKDDAAAEEGRHHENEEIKDNHLQVVSISDIDVNSIDKGNEITNMVEFNKNNGAINDGFTYNTDEKTGSPDIEEISKAEEPALTDDNLDSDSLSDTDRLMCKALVICVAYAANIGGSATLTGTGTNLVLTGVLETRYGNEHGVDFASWFIYSFPGMVLFELMTWGWLQIWFLGLSCKGNCCSTCPCIDSREDAARYVIRKQYEELGSMTFAEGAVLVHFVMLALLWMTREMGGYGWGNLFPDGYVSDATPAILISVLLFFCPSQPPNFLCCRRSGDTSKPGPRRALLDWKTVHHGLPWGIVLLLGGGFALAEGCQESGLSQWIGDQLRVLENLSVEIIILVVTTTVCFFTEVTSNVAIATIFLPILAVLCETICVNPLYLLVPSTIVCSYAFMLPVATPPNAIVFSHGHLTVPDMAKAGFALNIIGILLTNMWINTYGDVIFNVKTFPEWAVTAGNTTCLDLNATSTG
ncbi:solute carrier family 13 member 2-like [Saccoglossus kowalevskii]